VVECIGGGDGRASLVPIGKCCIRYCIVELNNVRRASVVLSFVS